eukprot:m51a1_g13482 hypothetical protein (73) ;mRNA; r:1843-2182
MAGASSCHQGVVGLAIATDVSSGDPTAPKIVRLTFLYVVSDIHYPVDVLPKQVLRDAEEAMGRIGKAGSLPY